MPLFRRALSLALVLVSAHFALAQPVVFDPNLNVTTFASGFSQPTGMAFLGNSPNDFFVIEKASGLVKRSNNNTVTNVLSLPVDSNSERGILGIALDPAFNSTRPYVYLYYSQQVSGAWTENRLSRFVWNGTTIDPNSEVRLFAVANDPSQNNGPNHNGGPIRFGPDGRLYGTTGDLNRNRAEQNNTAQTSTSALTGGYYRYDTSVVQANGQIIGDPYAGNPFRGNANAAFHPWYGYGVRNSFGMNFDPANGSLWVTENGPNNYDEINRVTAGYNSGWNKVMGPISRTVINPATDLVNLPGSVYHDPEFSWNTTIGVTSMAFLNNSSWGSAYNNAVLVGDNNTSRLYLLRLNAARTGFDFTGLTGLDDLVADNATEVNQLVFGNNFSVTTDIQRGPDGAIYVLSLGSGAIFRIAAIPEPQTWACLGVAAVASVWFFSRRKVKQLASQHRPPAPTVS
jgi:glucose/arabinose dehydrogenase